jgi:hypothetical protein
VSIKENDSRHKMIPECGTPVNTQTETTVRVLSEKVKFMS